MSASLGRKRERQFRDVLRNDGWVVGDRCGFGGEVDGRLDAVELVEAPLDAGGARGARHPFEREGRSLHRYRATS